MCDHKNMVTNYPIFLKVGAWFKMSNSVLLEFQHTNQKYLEKEEYCNTKITISAICFNFTNETCSFDWQTDFPNGVNDFKTPLDSGIVGF